MPSPLQQLRQNLTRDQQIVICYRAGNTAPMIAKAFDITVQRVVQILKAEGVAKRDNPRTRNRELYAFLGTNVPKPIKEAVEAEVIRGKYKSISAYLLKLIKEDLAIDIGEELK